MYAPIQESPSNLLGAATGCSEGRFAHCNTKRLIQPYAPFEYMASNVTFLVQKGHTKLNAFFNNPKGKKM
jgi:hypothetical protein